MLGTKVECPSTLSTRYSGRASARVLGNAQSALHNMEVYESGLGELKSALAVLSRRYRVLGILESLDRVEGV